MRKLLQPVQKFGEGKMPDIKLKASQVSEQGYCVIESVYDNGECQQIRVIFEELCRGKDGFSPEHPSISFHPVFVLLNGHLIY